MTTPTQKQTTTSTYNGSGKSKPDFYLFARVQDGDEKRIGPRIGVLFSHSRGEGFNQILDLPNGNGEFKRITLVGYPYEPTNT